MRIAAEKRSGTNCAKHRAPTGGWSGRSGNWFLTPFLQCLLFTFAAGVLCAGEATKPNIIFILSDDHATAAIGAYGSQINTTPNLDRLATEGMRFTQCFCTNSICTPSRASILTGLYSHATGVTTNYTHLGENRFGTFPQRLRQAGYQTALIGKAMAWSRKAPKGFDHFCIQAGAEYLNPVMNVDGRQERTNGYAGDITTRACLDWLAGRDADRPFFLLCTPPAPHAPFIPSPAYDKLYANHDIPAPATFDDGYAGRPGAAAITKTRLVPGVVSAIRHWNKLGLWKTPVPENLSDAALKQWTYQHYIKNYLRCVKSIDDGVGAVLDFLDEHKLASNTVVIYSSDQGFFLGEHGWYDKRSMYDPSIRMPLLVRWPGKTRPGSTCDAMVLNVDLAATLVDFAGAKVPDPMHGRSIRPLLAGQTPDDWRQAMYYRYYEYDPKFLWADVRPHYGIRTHRYKLIHWHTLVAWELYDLKNDPGEMTNLYGKPEHDALVKRLKEQLKNLRTELNDPSRPNM